MDSYSYNQTLVTSNVDTNFSSVTTSSSSREDLTTKLETIRRNFVGNVYDLDQIDVDGIYELEIKRRKIWEHTNIKLKHQLKSSLKPIRIVFIREPAFDAGGPLREFFTLYFDADARNIMQCTSSSFPVDTGRKLNVHKTFRRRPGRLLNVLCTFNLRLVPTGFTLLHGVKRLSNGDFDRFGLLIALAVIYGCPCPRNIRESLVCALLETSPTFYASKRGVSKIRCRKEKN